MIAMSIEISLTKSVLLGFMCLLLSACNFGRLDMDFAADRRFESRILDQKQDMFASVDPMALNQEIIDYIERNVRNRTSAIKIVDQLQAILFDPEYLNIEYDDQITRTAIETFEDRRGNCLSVVNLYIAMARHFGVDARFQTVKVRPSWDRRGEMLVLSQHINAIGRFNQSTMYVVDFTPEITLQQLTASTVDDREARALYFNNLGVEALIRNEYDTSLAYFKNALYLDPRLSIAWNNIATSYSRMDDKEIAEYAYRKAYTLDQSNATAINNLIKYYNNIGDTDTAERYSQAIVRFNNRNPYYHYTQGNLAYADGNYELARDHYREAIRRKDAEPDFYLALSKTYEQLGNAEEANRMYDMARLIVIAMGDIYLPSKNKVRIVDEKSILRSTSTGISVRTSR